MHQARQLWDIFLRMMKQWVTNKFLSPCNLGQCLGTMGCVFSSHLLQKLFEYFVCSGYQTPQDIFCIMRSWHHNAEALLWCSQANTDLIVELIGWICENEGPGAILVFVPGFQAIVSIKRQLDSMQSMEKTKVLPIHSQLPPASQRDIFSKPPDGIRKIVLATNIAETSITIDDIVYVVDCGTSNQTSYDSVNKIKCITPQFISKAQAHQRRGRAGRVQVI